MKKTNEHHNSYHDGNNTRKKNPEPNISLNDVRFIIQKKELVKILKIIEDSDNHSCNTRELLNRLGSQTYGHTLLLYAERLGLVIRSQKKPEGKGNWPTYNCLTKEGKKIARLASTLGIRPGIT